MRSGRGRRARSIPPAPATCSPPPSSSAITSRAIRGRPRPWRVARRRSRWKARDGLPCPIARRWPPCSIVIARSSDALLDGLRSGDYAGPHMTTPVTSRVIRITTGAISATAQLNASKTATAIWDALPIEAKAETWGDEIYFSIGIAIAPESRRDIGDGPAQRVEDGDRDLGRPADRGEGGDVGRRDLFLHRDRDRAGIAAGHGGHGRPRVLAAREGVLHLLRPDAGQPGRRNPAGQPGERARSGGRRGHRVQEGSCRDARAHRTSLVKEDTAP